MRNSKHHNRRGMTTLELALVMPFIIVMALGFIEMGNMYTAWMTVQKAAQSGARFAATGIGSEDGNRVNLIVQETEKWLESLGSSDKVVTVRSWSTTDGAGDGVSGNAGGPCGLVEVGVVFDYEPMTPILSSLFPDIIEITGSDRKLNEPWKPCDS